MKILVTGVGGQLGFDVMNELAKRGHEGIGSDILAEVTSIDAPYVQMDITDGDAVSKNIKEISKKSNPMRLSIVRHGQRLMRQKMRTSRKKFLQSIQQEQKI